MIQTGELINRARALAYEALREDTRYNGNPFIEHPDGVARILSDQIGLSGECIAAVYLHEAWRMHPEIEISGFPDEVMTIVDGLGKISSIKPKDTRLEAENYKKLIVQYSTDPRVTVIKIADRLEVMRNLAMFPKSSRDQKNLETLMLYIPLAHQLGLYRIKSELEDIFLKYTEPEQYKEITRRIKETEPQREALVERFINPLREKLDREGIRYVLKARTKSPYSIWKKMQAQQITFNKVYDLFAMRFIIDCEPDHAKEEALCWKVYSLVTEEYTPDTKRLRDWISKPRDNGYESLHTTVQTKEGLPVEVQIRTTRMDYIAEQGGAAHWSYKGI